MDNYLALFELIGVFARRRYQAAEHHFAALGLNHTEARLLALLLRAGGAATQEELSNMLIIDRTNAGRAMKKLEQEGFIERRKDETDKRANNVHITPKGKKAGAETAKLRKKIAKSIFGDLSEEDAGRAAALLNKALGDDA